MENEVAEPCPHGCGEEAWCVICNGRARREELQRRLLAELNKGKYPRPEPEPPRCDRILTARNRKGDTPYNWQHMLLEDDDDRYRGPGVMRPVRFAEARVLDYHANRRQS